jgi:hypothetical protein
MKIQRLIPLLLAALLLAACVPATPTPAPSRADRLPPHKYTPQEDAWPPQVAEGWSPPQPLPAPLNTSGGEDSPFLLADDSTLLFFFTPDLAIPVQQQLTDGLTGIWQSRFDGSTWSEPQRIVLEAPGELAMDGCAFVLGEVLWFCSVRQGNAREVDLYTASRVDGLWTDWQNAGALINTSYQVGEMHITADGQELYFGSQRTGGAGGSDLWVSHWSGDGWGEPLNLGETINTWGDEDRPFVTQDGQELWYDGQSLRGLPGPAVFRSLRQPDGSWGPPEEIVSSFAGEPNLSRDGKTLYFVHHYFNADVTQMLEVDIYVSYRMP